MELLRQVDAPLVGAVLNGLGAKGAYAYGYGYGGYAETKSTAAGDRFSRKGRVRHVDRSRRPPDLSEPATFASSETIVGVGGEATGGRGPIVAGNVIVGGAG